jgi:predicted RNase H-like HicB family nuclease
MDTNTKPTIEDIHKYSKLPYVVLYEKDEIDGKECYLAYHSELSGCMAQGHSEEEALANLTEARELYSGNLLRRGLQVPMPLTYVQRPQNANNNTNVSTQVVHATTFDIVLNCWFNADQRGKGRAFSTSGNTGQLV